jgi:hypothetical protein
MIDDQAPTIEPDTPTPITDSPPTHPRQPSSTGPVNGHEIIAEWDSVAEGAERIIAAQTLPIEIVSDVLSHEADIRGALSAGRPPKAAWMAALNLGHSRLTERLGHLGELTIIDGEDCITVGSGKPATIVEIDHRAQRPSPKWFVCFWMRTRRPVFRSVSRIP